MLKGYTCKHRLITSLLMALSLWGCEIIETATFKPRPIWILGLDVTTTVKPESFVLMRDTMIRHIVLARLRPGDEIQWMLLHENPEKKVDTKQLTGKVGTNDEVQKLAAQLHQIKQLTDVRIANNVGNIFAYAKRIGTMLEAEQQRVAQQGKSQGRTELLTMHLFTDGELPAKQGLPQPGPWPSNLDVWVWGVEQEHEARLTQWLTTTLGLPEKQFHIVRFSDWQTTANKVFGPRIGRPFVDVATLKRLSIH
jgi:hypothetical protein